MYDLFRTWIYHRKPQDTKNRPVLRTTVPAAPRQPEPRYARESGRWGEADNVHLTVHNVYRKMHIANRPTSHSWRGDLEPWVQGTPRHKRKRVKP